jgi:hypothetical protein
MDNITAVDNVVLIESYRYKLIIGSSICLILFILLYAYKICIQREYRIYIVRNKRIIQDL